MNKRKYETIIEQKQHKKLKNKNGITLIALVITIINMLILAGVSLNATIGENGIISKAKYSTFVSEMTDVEEALKIWQTSKILNDEDYEKRAPTNGLCTPEELQQSKRLTGEVGYYRIWSISDTKPILDLTESSESFDNKYESEFIYYPAGVQDLYYLNNEKLGINKKKKYLIDASTGIIYSVQGITLNGIQCYSLEMAKTVMEGYTDMPSFAELEINNSGKLAGNVSNKYKVDENGNYILDENGDRTENVDYNPYGFQIIADYTNDNIYKLYNNGDLYAKGKKGLLLNSNTEEKEKINPYVWCEFEVPTEIPGATIENITIIPGSSTMYIIDENKNLWAWGSNSYNKLGLTQEQQVEYTGREIIKLDIDGKKVNKVYALSKSTFVVTETNELYASGYNTNGELGIGNTNTSQNCFSKVKFDNPKDIIEISNCERDTTYTLILKKAENENKLYFAGSSGTLNSIFVNTDKTNTYVTNFIEILNSIYGTKPTGNIEELLEYEINTSIIKMDNKKCYKISNRWN